mmetsp:Transcript_53731/g.142399  ORF Transcript_53731/g.142399 Transcript_53731/m.142399 type:complete len:222 (+) Transcript_53731:465-1130(+)
MRTMVSMASSGYLPLAVSPESITQSVPSNTALATSVVSARVGRGFMIMLSSIWVAVTTGLPATLHLLMIIFCAMATFSTGISTPMSPRATMMPSLSARIWSKFCRPSWFSILEMMRMCLPPQASRCRRISFTWSPWRMKEAKMKSTPCSHPKARSSLSFSVSAGRSTRAPGRLMPLFSPRRPLLATRHLTRSASLDTTVMEMSPSSMRISEPTSTVSVSLG